MMKLILLHQHVYSRIEDAANRAGIKPNAFILAALEYCLQEREAFRQYLIDRK